MALKGSGIRIVVFDEQQTLAASVRNIILEPVKSFHELSSCILFIQRQTKENKVVVLITTVDDVLEIFESLTSIEAIFVLSNEERDVDTLPSKVIGVYLRTEILLRSLPETLDTIEQQLNARSILFNRQINRHDNPDFYFYNIWKNDDKDQKSSKKILADQSRLLFRSNNKIQYFIDDFEALYKRRHVLMWLDKHHHPFPYHLLISNALRTHNQPILSLSRFFIKNLSRQMSPAPSEPSYNQVYLGTKLPINLVDRLEQHKKSDVVAFQCFLLVTQSRADALLDATKSSRRKQMFNVLFKIELNGALCIIKGDTILLDMALPFRIQYVTRSPGSSLADQPLIIVKLIALDSQETVRLFEKFKLRQQKLEKKLNASERKTVSIVRNDEALADEHISRGEWSQAANILARIPNPNVCVLNQYGCLLREYLDNLPGAFECHQQALLKATNREKAETLYYLGKVHHSMKQYAEAFETYSEALNWFENQQEREANMIARCLVGLANAQRARGRLDDAFDYAERALAIREYEIQPKNDFDVAACLINMGNILYDQGDINRAFSCATRAVGLLSACGKRDCRFAAALNNLGTMHQANGDSIKAREYFQRALES